MTCCTTGAMSSTTGVTVSVTGFVTAPRRPPRAPPSAGSAADAEPFPASTASKKPVISAVAPKAAIRRIVPTACPEMTDHVAHKSSEVRARTVPGLVGSEIVRGDNPANRDAFRSGSWSHLRPRSGPKRGRQSLRRSTARRSGTPARRSRRGRSARRARPRRTGRRSASGGGRRRRTGRSRRRRRTAAPAGTRGTSRRGASDRRRARWWRGERGGHEVTSLRVRRVVVAAAAIPT